MDLSAGVCRSAVVMAHHVEPMDVDCVDSDFDNKENTYKHSNVLPCTEKGYEELDVSELNMKLRYSMTPASSPMSKSYTACFDDKILDTDDTLNFSKDNANLTRSLNSTMTKNDSIIKSLKSLPLQALSTQDCVDSNGNASVLRQIESTIVKDVTVTVSGPNDIDENLSLPSSSSSALHTPEATTPTKEIVKDGGSPILRGLKSVFNIFRTSQSPIPPVDSDSTVKQDISSLVDTLPNENAIPQAVASTPIAAHRSKDVNTSKRSSPYKDSIVFNDDLEKELSWKDETTVLFSQEKIPVHKLFFQQSKPSEENIVESQKCNSDNFNSTVEYMDISCNESMVRDKTMTEIALENNKHKVSAAVESDSEFVDCETTFTKTESQFLITEENNVLRADNAHNTHSIKNISLGIDSNLTINQPADSITSLSQIEKETNHYVTPSDYLDYSKETIDLLSKLENVEVNVTSKPEDSCQIQGIIERNSEAMALKRDIHDIVTPSPITEDHYLKTAQFEDQLNITQEVFDQFENTISLVENTITTKLPVDKEQNTDINVKPENPITDMQITQNNDVTVTNVKLDENPPTNIDQNTVDTSVIQDPNDAKTENVLNITSLSNIQNLDDDVKMFFDTLSSEMTNLLLNAIESNTTSTGKVPSVGSETEYEQPSDIPLPDEDDIDKNIVTGVEAHNLLNTTQTHLDMPLNKNLTTSFANLDISHEDIETITVVTTVEDNVVIDPNCPEIIHAVSADKEVNNLDSDVKSKNSESWKNITEANKSVHDIKIGDYATLSKPCDVSVIESITSNVLDISAIVIKPDNIEQICHENSSEHQVVNSIVNPEDELLSSNISALNNAIEEITFEVINEPVTKILDDIATEDKPEQPCNEIEDLKPMAITNNENISKILDLPDFENQIVVTDKIEENLNISDKTQNVIAKDDMVTMNTADLEIAQKSETPLEIKMENAEAICDININLENNTKSDNNEHNSVKEEKKLNVEDMTTNFHNKTFIKESNEKPTNVENASMISNPLLKDDNSEIVSENIQPISLIMSHNKSTEKVNTQTASIDTINIEVSNVNEDIIVSENNSPYVSLMAGIETVPIKEEETFEEKNQNSFVNNTNISSSPPITSKGYNFNFDEIDDPFATKTKIRLSPPLDTPTNTPAKACEPPKKIVGNRRKSQPAERKKPAVIKKSLNTSFDSTDIKDTKNETMSNTNINLKVSDDNPIKETVSTEINKLMNTTTQILPKEYNESSKEDKTECDEKHIHKITSDTNISNKTSIDSMVNETKTSSSEQSVYYSAGASSTDSYQSKNVFNLPEIDDMNFNPFATKSKMRQSPPPDLDKDPFPIKINMNTSQNTIMMLPPQIGPNNTIIINNANVDTEKIEIHDKIDTELMEKDTSSNISSTSTSSKATDNQNITCDINTEDEDTIEGPILEVDDIVGKITDFVDNADMMQFNDIPAQGTEDLEDGELFIDAEAYEFLLNQNPRNVVSDSGKESLFLKFDPLYAKRISSDGVLAALSNIEKKQSTPTKPTRPSLNNEVSPIAGPSSLNITYGGDNNVSQESNEDANTTVVKPMMVVTPAVNPAVTPRNKSITPTRSNRRSITFTSPAIAVIDRLLSMSANNSLSGQNTTMMLANREQTEADLALTQLRELLAEKEISVYNLRSESKELKDRLATMESQVRILETDGQQRQNKIDQLNKQLNDTIKNNKSMAVVVEEYERTIASLIAAIEQDKKHNAEERMRLINERDEQTAHLASMEVSFNDLHSKYEKSKQMILAFKANEDTYKKSIKDFEENLVKMQTNYDMLKNHATSKLNHANQELEKMKRAHEAEIIKLNAMYKRNCLHITSLEESLAQKTKANEELTAICDELINKVR